MKNLFLYRHFRNEFATVKSIQCFCIAAHSGEVYVCSNNVIYKLSVGNGQVDTLFDLHEYYDTHIPAVLNISFNSVTECLCLAFKNGDVVTLETYSKEIQCVGCVDSGLKALQWSPDQELVVMISGQDTVIVMTGTYDPVAEVDLHQGNFGEKQFITVGWGKKETQFHGSEGKTAARALPQLIEQTSVLDDGDPRITWRGDGSLFAVSTITPKSNSRQIRIFSRDAILQYTSEPAAGLEEALCWRPSGSLIASSQRLPNKHVIAFFEKNGLRHGEFLLPFAQNECKIHLLAWNSESSILAVWCVYTTGKTCLQLWTVNNYHWYLKQCLNFATDRKLLGIEWDILHGNRLHVMCEGLCYMSYDWSWITNCSMGSTEDDGAFVAVVDGAKILLTSFRCGIIPPPLCGCTLQVALPVNSIIFAPSKRVKRNYVTDEVCDSEISSNDLCTVLSDGSLIVFTESPSTKDHVQLIACNLKDENAADLHHWLWFKKDTFLCCRTHGTVSYLVEISLDLSTGKMNIRKEIPAGGVVVSIVLTSDCSGAVVQLADGTLFLYKLDQNEMSRLSKTLPEACEKLQITYIDGKDIVLGLSNHNRLYVDGQEVANNVTSLVVHSEFILLTTLRHMLLCAVLNHKGLQSLMKGQCGPGRRIERGARLVTSVPGGTCVVLQMPRGNLECIQPRPLTLHVATVLLDAGHYGAAFQLLRKQRINLNLLCDHQPLEFITKIESVVDELEDPAWLSLFLSELQEDSVTHSMYKEYYAHLDQLPGTLTNKVQVVCDAMLHAMLCRKNADRYLLPVLTSYVRKQTDKDLAAALIKVKAVKEAERENGQHVVSADEAMKYLLYLMDVNRLYDVALGLYDFDLVMFVAAKSNKDPKEYLPFLNKLRRMDQNYSFFVIDKHLKRFESALHHIALCPEEEHFEECLNLIKTHKLYSQALDIFPKGSPRYLDVATVYADYLLDKKLHHEAGIMYTRGQKYHKALTAFQVGGHWREALLAAEKLQYKENKLHELCQDLVSRLKDRCQFVEAAEILSDHLGDVEESIAVLVQGRLWSEAIWSSFHYKRPDMIETHVKPGIMEHLEQLSSQFTNAQKQFIAYKNRLNVVRTAKEQLHLEEKDADLPEEYDLYSDTSSIMTSTLSATYTGSRASGYSSKSSKNRRKHERKLLSLKEGTPYEEFALIRALHQLITTTNNATEEVQSLCRALLKFDIDKEASDLQQLLSDLIQNMDNSKHEIWTADLMQQPQMSFGPDATVNSVTKLQQKGLTNPGLALLGFHCDVDEICTLLGYYAVVSGYWRFGTTYCPIFKGQGVQVLDFLTLEDGTDTLS